MVACIWWLFCVSRCGYFVCGGFGLVGVCLLFVCILSALFSVVFDFLVKVYVVLWLLFGLFLFTCVTYLFVLFCLLVVFCSVVRFVFAC